MAGHSLQRCPPNFPGLLIGASLKLEHVAHPRLQRPDFPGLLIGASLKPREALRQIRRDLRFPRSIDRGLIEALQQLTASAKGLVTFPRSIDRGLIEAAYGALVKAFLVVVFPRSIDRGLIEARQDLC